MIVYTLQKQLISHPSFKKAQDQFRKVVLGKDRIDRQLYYFLLYDLDRKKYVIESDVTATYNQITVLTGIIPSKKEGAEKQVKIEEYNFDEPQINKYSIYD